jgi:flagellar biosynthesis protein FlhF
MRVKKFEAKSMKEALQMVKHELGPDAVILGARDNRKFGLAGEASVEVTAAVSESTLHKKHFTESRLTATDRAKFDRSDARTQRQLIERMVDSREKQNVAERRSQTLTQESELARENPRRAITMRSYIDIEDEDDNPGPRRRAALEKASGRKVHDLLGGFEQDFKGGSSGGARQDIEARREAVQAVQRNNEEQPPVTERAKTRIREAAREAWKNNPFFDQDKAQIRAEKKASIRAELEASIARGEQIGQQIAQQATQQMIPAGQPGHSGVPSAPGTLHPVEGKETEITGLKTEIHRLQKMLEGFQKVPQSFQISSMHPGAEHGISYDLSSMYQKLTEAGITIDNTIEILQKASQEIDPVQIKKRAIVDAWVARLLLNTIQIAPNPFQGRMHLFVGGAGSGKTSTLVKMASHLVVREKKRIAILTTDSFKVGAVDQLKIYCQILNVPFAVIRNRKDWEWILNQLPNVDHVLVDFPGLQLRDLDEIHLLKSLLPPEGNAPICHFSVAATSKDGDAYEIAKRYRVADYHDLVVTNLDQSVQHGLIYNLHKKTGRPLHSFGIGNRIPEDFEVASKERVLDLIFKLTKLKREMK